MIANKASARRRCCILLRCHLFTILLLFLITVPSESRYLKNEDTQNTLSRAHGVQRSVLEEDVDLENVVEDYYDDLWQYLEKAANEKAEAEAKKHKKKDGGRRKWTFPDYDYMSDMAVEDSESEADEKKFKVLSKNQTEDNEKENFTTANAFASNRSYGDSILADVVRANRESTSEEEFAQRSKEMRLKSIISQVLSFRGGSPKTNETVPDLKHYNALREIYEKNIKRIKTEDWTASYTEKVQSFYPSCDLPRNTDEDLWSDAYSMNLLFDLDYPSPQDDSTIMIVSAKLRLYKLPQENHSVSNPEATLQKTKPEKTNPSGLGVLPIDDDRQIRVSVYWYTRSLRRHRAKKKLLDSQMLSMYRPKWAEFNIRAAVRTWKDSGRNFGLVVTVEDEDGMHLSAEQYIQSMNCSKWTATVRPVPSIIIDKAHQYYVENLLEKQNDTTDESKLEDEKRKIYPYEPLLYPTIDLRTREVPNSEVKNLALINSAKIALESKFLNLTRRGFNLSNNSITIFLKNYNGGHIDSTTNPLKHEKTPHRKPSETIKDSKISYFQNVPIGSPSGSQNRNFPPSAGKKITDLDSDLGRGSRHEFSTGDKELGEGSDGEEREMPRIRHGRRQWETFQKSNANSKLRTDRNATDHH